MTNLKQHIKAAKGEIPADLVLKNGFVVNAVQGTTKRADVAIVGDTIVGVGNYKGKIEIDCNGAFIMPGLVDSHVHIESTMLTPAQFVACVLPHGTTTIIVDPHEIANVCGMSGMQYMIDELKQQQIDAKVMLPSCVPATAFETSGAVIDAKEVAKHIGNADICGLGEMMNFPGVIYCDDEVLSKIACAHNAGKIIDGHLAPLGEYELNAYAAAGISTNHETTTAKEMQEIIDRGMYVQIREGSSAKDALNLLKGVNKYNVRRCLLCTDDRHADEILRDGHINNILKLAVQSGIDPFDAILMATLNAAECYGMKNRGLVAPSYKADLIVVKDLKNFEVLKTFYAGKLVAENGKVLYAPKNLTTAKESNTIKIKPLSQNSFELKLPKNIQTVRAIEIIPKSLVTNSVNVNMTEQNDICKLAVVERHHATGNIGLGLLKNYGLTSGAIAQTIAHDSHNIVIAGRNDADMHIAVSEIEKLGGGIVIVNDGKVLASLALPVAGLMSSLDAKTVSMKISELLQAAYGLGVNKDIDPFVTLSFMALPVIPSLKLTDKGLFDVDKFIPVDF